MVTLGLSRISTSFPVVGGGVSQFWQYQDLESACYSKFSPSEAYLCPHETICWLVCVCFFFNDEQRQGQRKSCIREKIHFSHHLPSFLNVGETIWGQSPTARFWTPLFDFLPNFNFHFQSEKYLFCFVCLLIHFQLHPNFHFRLQAEKNGLVMVKSRKC